MGRWRPSKFFIFEICVLYDLFIWFTQTAPIFAWADACDFFNPLVLNCLYCHTDLLELNHLFCIYILRPEDIKGEVSFFTNFKTPDFDADELVVETDFIEKINIVMQTFEQLNKSESKEDFFFSKQPKLTFYLTHNISYTEIFSNDIPHQSWVLGLSLYKDLKKHTLIKENNFYKIIFFDFCDWLNYIQIVRSYIIKFIDYDIKSLFFYMIYYYFPNYYYFSNYFRKNIVTWYRLSKNLMKNTKFFRRFFIHEQTRLPELEKIFNKFFLYPEDVDKRLPFLEFRLQVLYLPQPFVDTYNIPNIIFSTKFFFSILLNWRWRWRKPHIYDANLYIDSIENTSTVLNVFFEMKEFNFLSIEQFFNKINYFNITKILQKRTIVRLYLPSYLFLLKKQDFLFLYSDNFLFFFGFREFNLWNRYIKILKKKLGWPKKKEFHYFNEEKNHFENKKKFNKISTSQTWNLPQGLFMFGVGKPSSFPLFIIWQLFINIKKPR